MSAFHRAALLDAFQCVGERCVDTCCKGWSMQVDAPTQLRYAAQAPELVGATEQTPSGCRMRRDASTDYCVKFENGLCGIQNAYGADFLSDACYLYPRITRQMADETFMSATLSCPEIARLALLEKKNMTLQPAAPERLPHEIKNYLPEGLTAAQALAVHEAFLHAALAEDVTAEDALAHIVSVAHSFALLPVEQWPEAAPFYLAQPNRRLSAPEALPEDPFNLLHALCGIIISTHTRCSERLYATIQTMEAALGATLDWQNVTIALSPDSAARYGQIHARWNAEYSALFSPVLKQWLHVQLSGALFPFAGLGATLAERITVIGVRFATFRLALMCEAALNGLPGPDIIIRIAQSLARVLDHLGDAQFSIKAYNEAGWTREKRLRGLLQ